jgi:hypothetical protein
MTLVCECELSVALTYSGGQLAAADLRDAAMPTILYRIDTEF